MYRSDLGEGTSSAVLTAGGARVRVHTVYGKTGVERVEEYSVQDDALVLRRWRSAGTLGGQGKWTFEVGEAMSQKEENGFRPAAQNPVFLVGDSKDCFLWRVRNLPYPKPTYSLSVDDEKQQIVLRTSNRKYFKRFDIPALKRNEIPLEQDAIDFHHSGSTLVISYEKPQAVKVQEEAARIERRKSILNAAAAGSSTEARGGRNPGSSGTQGSGDSARTGEGCQQQ
eukprot:g2437.t1